MTLYRASVSFLTQIRDQSVNLKTLEHCYGVIPTTPRIYGSNYGVRTAIPPPRKRTTYGIWFVVLLVEI